MGTYINIGNEGFARVRRGEYIDKSGLIGVITDTIGTEKAFTCVTRSRRFGKSIAAKTLAAYYDESCDSDSLFAGLEITSDPSYKEHLNKYPVIFIDISQFVRNIHDDDIASLIERKVKRDVLEAYPEVRVEDDDTLFETLLAIVRKTGKRFILIIDEWDAICRENKPGTAAMEGYVSWLRSMFKPVNAVNAFAAVYMTGILPIKKYKKAVSTSLPQSALNNFIEYSMVEPRSMGAFFGFTKAEVQALALKHGVDFDELEKWYDGYQIGDEQSMFNPNSVMQAIDTGRCRSFWATTGAFDVVSNYIKMNFDGLKDNIINMLAGGRCSVDPTGFSNDLSIINSRDDALTVLIHLGYLSYDWRRDECYIPNREVAGEMVNAVKSVQWKPVADAIEKSQQLLQATLEGDADAVAKGVDAAHDDNTSILSYNDENSLACVLSIAYYYAKNDYIVHRELASGKGFLAKASVPLGRAADLVLIPRKNVDKPAIVLELRSAEGRLLPEGRKKYNKDADTAIAQIHRRQYPAKISEYTGDILLVGINYDPGSKTHTCKIECLTK